MSHAQGKLFKVWLTDTGKSPNTANGYRSALNTINHHLGRDVLLITDVDELTMLYQQYGPGGEFAEIGASNSNNVQSGLKQWLEYQRQLSRGAIAGYADQRVIQLLDKGTVEEQAWVWMLLTCFRERYPQADHWTVNITPADIRIGVREQNSLKGKPAFTLYWYGGEICCSLRGVADHRALMDAQEEGWEISAQRCPTQADVEAWMKTVDKVLENRQLPLKGSGLVPSDYGQAEPEGPEAVIDLSATKPPLNQILFGPPGTGKTYATINQALAILAPEFLAQNTGNSPEARQRLKAEFERFASAGRVRFVTFHQSFSYEDFVEGIRADSDSETGQLRYPIEAGVFKRICDDAKTQPVADLGVRPNAAIWKISIDGSGTSPSKNYCLTHGEARIGWGQSGDLSEDYEANDYYQGLGSGDKGTLHYFAEQIAVGDILLCIQSAEKVGAIGVVTSEYRYEAKVPDGVNPHYRHVRSVRWLYRDINLSILPINDGRQFTLKTVYAMNRFTWADLLTYLQHEGVKAVEPSVSASPVDTPYVLIIDEINRGNVSRIFGELITLIEPSKRDGADEALSLQLPYSKKPFTVPQNVHIIGTMNTADRSLAGLDIALRRRFVFREMLPEPHLLDGTTVEGVNIGQLLRVMNQRIEVLLDREHCLGHAYFMPLINGGTLAQLELIFRNQVLPLLQEYFFEDWQRIQWVLNDHRKPVSDCFVLRETQNFLALFGDKVPAQDQVWRINPLAFSRPTAYAGVISTHAGTQDAISPEEQSA
ncbi:AAA family ATPase [Pseudomonas sp. UBA5568]|uniref:AAA family ATPase n=1 Tax=Pseudomonas sp. UBA5568 TaxID=1947319 RepID=UPI002595A500|nr:AAA family ATPase [Pseudomonas sp. UBA5568]